MTHPSRILFDNGFRELKRIELDAERLAVSDPLSFRIEPKIIDALISVGVEEKEIVDVVFSDRDNLTLSESVSELNRNESDRAFRLARIIQLAERVFANHEKAFFWLRLPNGRLSQRTPFSCLETETGSRIVEELLFGIDYGLAA